MAFILSVLAVPAAAQSLGVRAGVSVDPEQFYFGGHAQTPPLVDRLHFRPSIEIGLGSETTIAAFNVEFAYLFQSPEAWSVYAGAGPALNIVDRADDTDTECEGSGHPAAALSAGVSSPASPSSPARTGFYRYA